MNSTSKKIDIYMLQKLNAEAAVNRVSKKHSSGEWNGNLDEKETEEADTRYYLELSTADYDKDVNNDDTVKLKPACLLKNQPKYKHLKINNPTISIITEKVDTDHNSNEKIIKTAKTAKIAQNTKNTQTAFTTNQMSNNSNKLLNTVPIPSITPPYPSKKAVLLRYDGSYDEIDYVTRLPQSQQTSMIELILGDLPHVIGELQCLSDNGNTNNDTTAVNNENDGYSSDDSDEIIEMDSDEKYTLTFVCSNQNINAISTFGNNINYNLYNFGMINFNKHCLPYPFNHESIHGDILVYKLDAINEMIVDFTIDEYKQYLKEQNILANDIMQQINQSTSVTYNNNNNNNNKLINNKTIGNKYDDIDISILSSDDEKNAKLQELSPMKSMKQKQTQCTTTESSVVGPRSPVSATTVTNSVANVKKTKIGKKYGCISVNNDNNNSNNNNIKETATETLLVLKSDPSLSISAATARGATGTTTGSKIGGGARTRPSVEHSPRAVIKTSVSSEHAGSMLSSRNNVKNNGNYNKIQFIGGINGVMTDIIDISDIILEFDESVNGDTNDDKVDGANYTHMDKTVTAIVDDIIQSVCQDFELSNISKTGLNVETSKKETDNIIHTNKDVDVSADGIESSLRDVGAKITQWERDYLDALQYVRLIANARDVQHTGDYDMNGMDCKLDDFSDLSDSASKIVSTESTLLNERKSPETKTRVDKVDIMPIDINETREQISNLLNKIEMSVSDKVKKVLELSESEKDVQLLNQVCNDVAYIHSIVKQSYQDITQTTNDSIKDEYASSEYSDDFETESVISEKKDESADGININVKDVSVGVLTEQKSTDQLQLSKDLKDSNSSVDITISEKKLKQIYQTMFDKNVNNDELENLMLMVNKV